MSQPSSTKTFLTFCPWAPVWWVTSCMPIILLKISPASSGLRASFTPPPLPRPPAWIWAFTTTTPLPEVISSRAAAKASSADCTSLPRGTATPCARRISLAWYSWIFMAAPQYTAPPGRASEGAPMDPHFTTPKKFPGTGSRAMNDRLRAQRGDLAHPTRTDRCAGDLTASRRNGHGRHARAALRRRRRGGQALRRLGHALRIQPRDHRHHDPRSALARLLRSGGDRLRRRRRRIRIRRRAPHAQLRAPRVVPALGRPVPHAARLLEHGVPSRPLDVREHPRSTAGPLRGRPGPSPHPYHRRARPWRGPGRRRPPGV